MSATALLVMTVLNTAPVSINTTPVTIDATATASLARGAGMLLPPIKPKHKLERGAGMLLPPIKPKVVSI